MIKRLCILFSITLLCAILTVLPAASADTSALTLDEVRFYSMNESIYTIKTGIISAQAFVTNSFGEEKPVMAVATVYEGNKLTSIGIDIVRIAANTARASLVCAPVSVENTDCTLRVMVFNNMQPISAPVWLTDVSCKKEIKTFALTINNEKRMGVINENTREITVDVPYYTAGQGQLYSRPDVTRLKAEITSIGGEALPVSGGEYQDFTNPVKYVISDSNGNKCEYTVKLKYSVLQFATDFENAQINDSGLVTGGFRGAANLGAENASGANKKGTLSLQTIDGDKKLNMVKSDVGGALSFSAGQGGASYFTTDCKMEFDFCFNALNANAYEMYWSMGSTHNIIPVYLSQDEYCLQYRCGSTGNVKNIPGLQTFKCGTTYHLTYMFSRDVATGLKTGELYINHKLAATLPDEFTNTFSPKLSPIIAFTGFYSGMYDVSFDNIEVTYREDTKNDITNLHLIGDSIVYEYPAAQYPQQGWGAYLDDMFNENVRVTNHAVAGHSTGMALGGGEPKRHDLSAVWPLLKYNLYEGDYVMISLGWNENSSLNNFQVNEAGYKANLQTMIADIEAAGATAILVTPTIGAYVSPITNDTNRWANVMKQIAAENSKVVCLDLNSKLYNEFSAMELNTLKASYYMADGTHFNEAGAQYVAKAIRTLLQASCCQLKNDVKVISNEITSFSLPLTNKSGSVVSYEGLINDTNNKITVFVPNSDAANIANKYFTDFATAVSAVTPNIATTGTVENNTIRNFNTSQEYVVTDDDGVKRTYTVTVEQCNIQRGLNMTGCQFYPETGGALDRHRMLNYQAVTGNGVARWTTSYISSNITSLTKDPDDASNDVFRVQKTAASSTADINSYGGGAPSGGIGVYIAEARIRLNSLSTEDRGFYFGLGENRHAFYFTREDKQPGDNSIDLKYNKDGGESTALLPVLNAPEMELCKWYKIKCVHRNTAVNGGFTGTTDLYINDKYITTVSDTYGADMSIFNAHSRLCSGNVTYDLMLDDWWVSYILD